MFLVGLVITVLLLLVGHWFPWFKRLTRIQAYVYGTLSILVGQAVWLGLQSVIFWQVAAFAVLGGSAVWAAYQYDWLANKIARRCLLRGRSGGESGEGSGKN